jgi:hypothetical protein
VITATRRVRRYDINSQPRPVEFRLLPPINPTIAPNPSFQVVEHVSKRLASWGVNCPSSERNRHTARDRSVNPSTLTSTNLNAGAAIPGRRLLLTLGSLLLRSCTDGYLCDFFIVELTGRSTAYLLASPDSPNGEPASSLVPCHSEPVERKCPQDEITEFCNFSLLRSGGRFNH